MLSANIKFKSFKVKKKTKKIQSALNKLLINQNPVLRSLGTDYKYSYDLSLIHI